MGRPGRGRQGDWNLAIVAVALTLVLAWLASGPVAPGRLGVGAAWGAPLERPSAQVAPLSPPAPVKVGLVPVTSAAGLYVALDRGYFRDEGLEVSVEPFDTGGQMVPAIGTGQVDVGAGGAVSAGLFNAIQRGIPMRIVGTQSLMSAGHGIVGVMIRKDLYDSGSLREPGDLRGKRIGLPVIPSTSGIVLDAAMARGGLTLRDADLTEINLADITIALANRSIDAGIQTEPTATASVERGVGVRAWTADELTPGLLGAAYLYSPQFADQRSEAAGRFMVGLLRGVRDYQNAVSRNIDRDAVFASLIRHTPLKDRAMYDRIILPGVAPDGYIDLDLLQNDINWYIRQGYVPEGLTARSLVDHQFVDYAIGRLGRYQ